MNKPKKIKFKSHEKERGSLDLTHFGQFRIGLTGEEIKNYLRARADKKGIERIYKSFCNIAGCNTVGSFQCPDCNVLHSLMYRWDVKRFADVLFGVTKDTYFD